MRNRAHYHPPKPCVAGGQMDWKEILRDAYGPGAPDLDSVSVIEVEDDEKGEEE